MELSSSNVHTKKSHRSLAALITLAALTTVACGVDTEDRPPVATEYGNASGAGSGGASGSTAGAAAGGSGDSTTNDNNDGNTTTNPNAGTNTDPGTSTGTGSGTSGTGTGGQGAGSIDVVSGGIPGAAGLGATGNPGTAPQNPSGGSDGGV